MASQRPLRVCHLGKYYPPAPGGIETHVRTLARAQAEQGADVQVLCINHADSRGRDVTWLRYGATETTYETDGPVRVTRLGRSAHVARLDVVPDLRRAFARLKSDPVDVLHLHTPNPTMLLAVAALRPWAPLVITHHSDIIKQKVLKYAFAPFERLVYGRAAAILSNSPPYAGGSPLLQRHGDRVQTLPMGLKLDAYHAPSPAALAFADRLRSRHGSPLWLMVGRCVYYKGIDTAIHALSHVPGKLLLVGHGPMEVSLRQLARERDVADRIVWLGQVSEDELAGAYQAATDLWFPSNARSEAFGLVQVEAMASGCPVINTAIPHSGVPWVSPHDETGLTIDPFDPGALAAASRRLLEEPGLRPRLAEEAGRRAAGQFNQELMAERTLEVYWTVIGHRESADLDITINRRSLLRTQPLAMASVNVRAPQGSRDCA